MATLAHVATIGAPKPIFNQTITELAVIQAGSAVYLVSVADMGTALGSYRLASDAAGKATLNALKALPDWGGYLAAPRIEPIGLGGKLYLAITGQSGSVHRAVAMSGTGAFQPLSPLFRSNELPGDIVTLRALSLGSRDYLLAARDGEESLTLYRAGDGARLHRLDSANAVISRKADAEISDLDLVHNAGGTYAIASSARGGTITVFKVADSGLAKIGGIGPGNEIGISAPHQSSVLTTADGDFLVTAGGESDSLTVFQVANSGNLTVTDHVIDSRDTRFQSATSLATLQIDGRGYVVAGGADDGISVLTLDGQGRLILLATLADDAGMSLANVSAIAAEVIGGKIAVFVSSATESGITQFSFDPGRIGMSLKGSGRQIGTRDNDIIIGAGATSLISGGGGDDVLIGRTGHIRMQGGPGRDIFIPGHGADLVTIQDYHPRYDRLDLSELAYIRSVAQLKIVPTATGAALQAGTVRIEVQTATGRTLAPGHFTDEMFKLAHYRNNIDYGSLVTPVTPDPGTPSQPDPPDGGSGRYSGPAPLPPPPLRKNPILGTGRDDRLSVSDKGGAIDALRGNDRLIGGAGRDFLVGNNGRDTIIAGAGSDEVYGGAADDLIFGDGDHDRLSGHGGDDTIHGGPGDDRIWGYVGRDELHGNLGNDVILGGPGADRIFGGPGDDLVFGEGGHDTIRGEAGHDKLIGIVGHNVIISGPGNDWVRVWGPGNRIDTGDGNDSVTGGMEADYINLRTHDDVARGRMDADTILGGDGSDRIYGNDGDDFLRGEKDDDKLYGGIGNDTVLGDTGSDVVNGDGGLDWLRGGPGDDQMNGGLGADSMWGEDGSDDMQGGAGPDKVYGQDANDTVRGGLGNDIVDGGTGNDLVDGGFGNDRLIGGIGNDTLTGDHGNDTILGGDGDDVLDGGERYDQLTGGAGADRFVFTAPRISSRPDVIRDFDTGQGDLIDLTALPDNLVWIGNMDLSGRGRPEVAMRQIPDATQLIIDLNGDAEIDFRINVIGSAVTAFDLLF